MLQSTKKEYVIIARKYEEVVKRLGDLAPYLSSEFKINHTMEYLEVENKIKVKRSTIYTALKLYPKLKSEEVFLLNE